MAEAGVVELLESAKADIKKLLTSYPLYADMKRDAIGKIEAVIKRLEEE